MTHSPRPGAATRFRLLVATLPIVSACNDPYVDISGSVHRTDGEPVSAVTVRIDCPDGSAIFDTAPDGTFHGEGLIDGSKACQGHVIVFGEPTNHFRPMDHCVEHDGDRCTRIEADLVIPFAPDD